MKNLEKWKRATEEIKFYDLQLKQIPQTNLFKEMLAQQAPKIEDPKTQLFNPDKREVKRRVSNRTTKK